MNNNPFFPLPEILEMKKVLCVQPHPDDMDISIGGIIQRLAENGAEIHYLTVTDDSAGFINSGYSTTERQDLRKKEQIAAGSILGVSQYHWLDFPDAGKWDHHDARDKIVNFIRQIRPEIVITVDPWLAYEAHMDHIRTGHAAAEAAILYNLPLVGGPMPDRYETFELEAVCYVWTNNPNTVIDVTSYHETKFHAIAKHESQFTEETLEEMKTYLKYRAGVDAEKQDFELGETLKVVPPQMLHCFPEARDY